jgi:hypothetical protein
MRAVVALITGLALIAAGLDVALPSPASAQVLQRPGIVVGAADNAHHVNAAATEVVIEAELKAPPSCRKHACRAAPSQTTAVEVLLANVLARQGQRTVVICAESASGPAVAGGDPVNSGDPSGDGWWNPCNWGNACHHLNNVFVQGPGRTIQRMPCGIGANDSWVVASWGIQTYIGNGLVGPSVATLSCGDSAMGFNHLLPHFYQFVNAFGDSSWSDFSFFMHNTLAVPAGVSWDPVRQTLTYSSQAVLYSPSGITYRMAFYVSINLNGNIITAFFSTKNKNLRSVGFTVAQVGCSPNDDTS